MENIEHKSRIDEAKDAIRSSSLKIEDEFKRSANSWMACFGSRVFVVETYLASDKVESEIGSEKYIAIMDKLTILKERLFSLKDQFPDKNTVPPENIKQELLKMLDVFS